MKKMLLIGAITGAAIYCVNKALKKNKESLHDKINNVETSDEKVEILENEINKINKVEQLNNILFAYSIVVTNMSILLLAKRIETIHKNLSALDCLFEPGKKYAIDDVLDILRNAGVYLYV